MFTSCTYTHDSGETCKSPAVRGTSLCYNHTAHQKIKRRQPDDYPPFELPRITSKSGVIVAITEVLNRLALRQIKRSEADTFLRGFSLLTRLMTELDEAGIGYTMQPNETRSAAEPEPEPTNEDLQQMIDEIAEGLGVEMPTLEEMLQLQASMPNGTPEKALEHWISTGRIRPRQQPDGVRPRPSNRPRPSAQHRPEMSSSQAGQIDLAAHSATPSNPQVHS